METWVFVAIIVLSGLVMILCGLKADEINLYLIAAGTVTASFSSLAFIDKVKKWLHSI